MECYLVECLILNYECLAGIYGVFVEEFFNRLERNKFLISWFVNRMYRDKCESDSRSKRAGQKFIEKKVKLSGH